MTKSLSAMAAFAFCLAGTPAAAEPFDNFVAFCMDPSGEAVAAGAAAKLAGWIPMPEEAMAEVGADFQDAKAFMSMDPSKGRLEDLEILLTGWGRGEDVFDLNGVRLDACIVVSVAGDPADLQARLDSLLGMESMEIDGERAWAFSRQGAGYRPENNLTAIEDEDLLRAARERKLYMVGLLTDEGMTGLMLGALRPE